MGKWTWTNDNDKHKLHHINSGNFSVMMRFKEVVEFAITSQVLYIQNNEINQIWTFSFKESEIFSQV